MPSSSDYKALIISMNCIYPVIKVHNIWFLSAIFWWSNTFITGLLLKKKFSNFSVKNHHFNHLLKSFRAIAGIYTEQTMRFLFLLVIRFGCTDRNASFNSVMFCKSVDNLGVLRCIVWSPLYRPQYFSLAFYKLHPIISSSWFW